MFRMRETEISPIVFLLGVVVVGGICSCHYSVDSPQPAPSLSANTIVPSSPGEIHVDQNCRIVQGSKLLTDTTICHLEGVHTSNHWEETDNNEGVMHRSFVIISEQDYLLQDVTDKPVTFVVEHHLPKEWEINSDLQPIKISGATAVFRVNTQPGQIVRLHVSMRHAS
jgi:hypothetical protein